MVNTIQDTSPFIKLNLYTVPLIGTHIKRTPQGKKEGFTFPTNWKEQHSTTLNDLPTPIGGLLTGEQQNIVAIDCDNTTAYNLFTQIDPTNTAILESIDKLDSKGNPTLSCTILYRHTPDLPPPRSLKGDLDLDWINGDKMVFLPTAPNHTKHPWATNEQGELVNHKGELVIITTMPEVVKNVLAIVVAQPTQSTQPVHHGRSKGYLAKPLEQYIFKDIMGEYIPAITRLLTPKEYRTALYHKQKHIHPKDVGVRHDYLFKIFCILAGDNTVSEELARDTIMWFNSLLDPPRSSKQMESEIIGSIISGRQKNQQGEPYWVYDEHWDLNQNWTAVTKKHNHLLEVFYDEFYRTFIIYNTVTDNIQKFELKQKATLMSHIQATTIGSFNQKEAISNMKNVDTIADPAQPFGYFNEDNNFNTFKKSVPLQILADPSMHKEDYKEPTEFINFITNLAPTESARTYLLRFLLTKLTTFQYSPTIFSIVGVPGSGKNALLAILRALVGDIDLVATDIDGSELISGFNLRWGGAFFGQFNELSDTLPNRKDQRQALGILKILSGATDMPITGKGRDTILVKNVFTAIVTSNDAPLPLEDDDRRNFYIHTPTPMVDTEQSQKYGNTTIYKRIMEQVNDIAYWIATTYTILDENDYIKPPQSEDKYDCTQGKMRLTEKVIYLLKEGEFEVINNILLTPPIHDKGKNNDVISTTTLGESIVEQLEAYSVDTNLKAIVQELDRYLKQYFEKPQYTQGKGANGKPKGYNVTPKKLEAFIYSLGDKEAESIDLPSKEIRT